MDAFQRVESHAVVIAGSDIDTDQITPARFLKITDKEGLADALFADWRRAEDGSLDPAFPLNRPEARSAQILVAGHNFGCGSSREHAPWALLAWGFRAVITTGFAEIFRNNALGVGLLPVQLDADAHADVLELCTREPQARLTVDLQSGIVELPDGRRHAFAIEAFARYCLLNGVDPLGYLLAAEQEIGAFELRRDGAPITLVEKV